MASRFAFENSSLGAETYLGQGQLTRPSTTSPLTSRASAVAVGAIDSLFDVDIIAITLVAGRSYLFDIDQGFGDSSGGSVDLQFSLINARGTRILTDSGSDALDAGSLSTRDPLLPVSVNVTGTYYLAVHSETMEYVNGEARFAGSGGLGDYTLTVSTTSIPRTTYLTDNRDVRFYNDAEQNIQALGGNDVIHLQGGNDIGTGGTGNDTLYGGAGSDDLAGGFGVDNLQGGTGDDVLVGAADADLLYGGDGNDALNGGLGNDFLTGQNGNDSLIGNSGNDRLFGGTGADLIRGGAGVDALYGGADADTFHFLRGEAPYDAVPSNGISQDRIFDFQGIDVIDLSDLYAGTLAYRGFGAAFTAAFQVRLFDLRDSANNGFQEVQVNLDQDTAPEFAFLVDYAGTTRLTSFDFLL